MDAGGHRLLGLAVGWSIQHRKRPPAKAQTMRGDLIYLFLQHPLVFVSNTLGASIPTILLKQQCIHVQSPPHY